MAKKPYFSPVDPRANFPEMEEKTLKFWKKNGIFEKSVISRPESKKWTFLDGPPFITGLPHYGSLLSSIPKDVFPRFWTMKGFRVRRVWGWDCHGLPAENKVENKLGVKRKKDIEEKIGIKRFIDECKLYVRDVSSEWEWYVEHIGRWVDFKNAYKTMDLPFMESVMWVFKSMYDKGLIYKGLRVSLYCPHCSTPISNFEVAMDAENYKTITEPANIYKYKVEGQENTYLLAWSTTPWNKLATPALAVNPNFTYLKVREGHEYYILAKTAKKILKRKPDEVVESFPGKQLLGLRFVPHYDFYPISKGKKAFVVVGGDFVTADEGTGIVTLAAYGEDDLAVMQKENIQIVLHVDEEGIVTKDSPVGPGMYYLAVNSLVNKDLERRGLIYREDPHTHTVAHCWRCGTRLIYAPQDAWYVNIQKLKSRMKKNNEKINWFPGHFKHGRFLKSMEMAPDWCISRSRYWGSPVPVWECDSCGERYVPGSLAELEKLSGKKVKDLHRPEIDEVMIKCRKCEGLAKRVPEVLDSWIEAGSASFAERHFPFAKGIKLQDFFPPDFIAEYTGQIRAWFYVLHVIGTALYDSEAFKNVVVEGVILGTDGRKMSKNYGNYPDPKEMIQKYGGDALRLYLLSSPVMRGEDILISEVDYRNNLRLFLLPLWNVYNFFITYADLDNWTPSQSPKKSANILDQWIRASLKELTREVTLKLESYDTSSAVELFRKFITNDLSGWYVRRSRKREDKKEFYATAYEVLASLVKTLAPLAPFVTEEIFRNLTRKESVHLADWPEVEEVSAKERKILNEMQTVREMVEKGHALRKEKKVPVRQPLNKLRVANLEFGIGEYEDLIKDELNVKNIEVQKGSGKLEVSLDFEITPELQAEGEAREIIRKIQIERKKLKTPLDAKVNVFLPDWPEELTQEIKSKAQVAVIKKGDFKVEAS
jgi:isoleucyl-tRNA synthetase